jgi:predicted pyridoxine 5'-phosphate oxidase superfamily flavin-nucleotide-binding protein
MIDPYHSGERAIQEMTGERDQAILNGRIIAGALPPRAGGFLERQQMCALGWRSPAGDVWASMLAGRQGFARVKDDGGTLALRLDDDADILSASPPFAALQVGDPLGVLFFDPSTRRRLRINGRVADLHDRSLAIAIDQAYPNCPKYIQQRTLAPAASGDKIGPREIETGDALTPALRSWIGAADTFFVASAHPAGGVDCSHRGGAPGFVRLDGDELRIPDYPGNSMFNTLGNFRLKPHAGLAFVEFAANRQLKLTGRVSLDLEAGKVGGDARDTGGTGRRWTFRPTKWIVAPLNLPMRWAFVEASPFNP